MSHRTSSQPRRERMKSPDPPRVKAAPPLNIAEDPGQDRDSSGLANPSRLALGARTATVSRVSGTPSHSTRNAKTAQIARNRNAAEYPKLLAMKPATALLNAAPSPQDAALAPCARL